MPSLLYVATIANTIGNFLGPYARHFRALGWRVDAAANGAEADAALREQVDHVHELPLSRSILDLRGLVRGERAIAEVVATGYDIVHVHTPIASFLTRLAVRRMPLERRPAVAYTAHGFHFHHGGGVFTNLGFLTAERIAGRWTDRLVVINDEDHQAARRHRIVPRHRLVRMAGIGVGTDLFARSALPAGAVAAAAERLGLVPGTPYFVAVAEFSRRKRMADIVEALSLMQHDDAILVLVGDGPERRRLEDLVIARGVAGRVRFAGVLLDVRPVVAGAVALVLASDREGLARAIMEALALEVPVIASTARGNRELVTEDSGFIYPVGDVAAIARHMDWVAGHHREAVEMGRRGRSRMVERYAEPQLLRRHEELYAALLAERAARDRS